MRLCQHSLCTGRQNNGRRAQFADRMPALHAPLLSLFAVDISTVPGYSAEHGFGRVRVSSNPVCSPSGRNGSVDNISITIRNHR